MKFTCTCSGTGRTAADHNIRCDLRFDWDFEDAIVEWDRDLQSLVDFGGRPVPGSPLQYDDEITVEETQDDPFMSPEDLQEYLEARSIKTQPAKKSTTEIVKSSDKSSDKSFSASISSPLGKEGWSGNDWGGGWGDSYSSYSYMGGGKCRHYQQELWLTDDIAVYPSSCHSDRQDDPTPALGIYLDGMWTPDTIAFYVGCPDYGIPVPAMWQVIHIAREGLRVASEGEIVEIGCIGGHGRTGLMLSVMYAIAQDDLGNKVTGPEAISYVRDNYCDRAVESEKQEWYVACLVAELAGEPWPELPKPKPKPKPIVPTPTETPGTKPVNKPLVNYQTGKPLSSVSNKVEVKEAEPEKKNTWKDPWSYWLKPRARNNGD